MVNLKLPIPPDFLKEEIRWDYCVSSQMKEVWAVELDLLSELERVCNKYSIKYYAFGGTLLGALRHKGFVPWDDDLDVVMKREDYVKLCNEAKDEFIHPYFFQIPETETGYRYGYAHLRNSETTSVEKNSIRLRYKFNQGIKIDIFPVDNYIDNLQMQEKQWKKTAKLLKLSNLFVGCTKDGLYFNNRPLVMFIRKTLSEIASPLMLWIANNLYKKFEVECQRYNNQETEFVSLVCLSMLLPNRKFIINKDFLSKTYRVPFEFSTIQIGNDSEGVLQMMYGDWKKPIKGASVHGQMILDASKSYKEYIK